MENAVSAVGMKSLTATKIRAQMQATNDGSAPSTSVITQVLHCELGLSHRSFNSANLRYNSRLYDDKRVLISRLVVQYLMDDHLVICVDESGLSCSNLSNRRW